MSNYISLYTENIQGTGRNNIYNTWDREAKMALFIFQPENQIGYMKYV